LAQIKEAALRTIAIALVGACIGCASAHAQAAFPKTQSEHYQAGQKFASCSAYFQYGASLARANHFENSASAIEDMERGWKLAGLMLLVEGLDETRQAQAEATFENFQAIKIAQLKAGREIAEAQGKVFDPAAEFQSECGEWIVMQKTIIQSLRSGPITH
jgi:hypothetical protein